MFVLVIHDQSDPAGPSGPAGGRGRRVPLAGERRTIGSAEGNSIVLRRAGIAPEHCVIEPIEDGYKLVDLHTEQGTLVNGAFIAQRKLEPGDRIELGGCVLVFERRSRAPSQPAGAPKTTPAEQAEQARQDARAKAAGKAAGSGSPEHRESVPAGQRSRTSGGLRAARTAVYTLTAVLLIAGFGSLVPGLLGRADGATYGEDRLSLAAIYEDAGHFARAVRVLRELEQEPDSGVKEQRIAAELDRLQKLQFREQLGREELAALIGDQSLAVGEKLERVRSLQGTFGDLPRIREEIRERINELELVALEASQSTRFSLVDLAQMSEALLAQRDFSGARNVWMNLRESRLAVDLELLEAAEAVVDAAAGVEARELLERVDTLVSQDDDLGALIVLDDTELRAFRGTSSFNALNTRALELEALVAERSPFDLLGGAMPGELSGSRGVEPDAPEAPAPPEGTVRSETAPRVASRDLDQAVEAGDALFFEGRLEQALSTYSEGLDARLTYGERSRLARRIERARRAEWFLDSLCNYVEAEPIRVATVAIADRSGERKGVIRGVRDGEFQVDSEGERYALPPEQLSSNSALALARSFRLAPEDQLNLIFYRMTDGIPAGDSVPPEFKGLIRQAMESPERKGAADSAIAFLRGLPEVPEWGFFEHEGEWLSFREREQAQNHAAIRAAVAKLDKQGGKAYDAGLEELKSLMPVARAEVVEVLAARRSRMLAELLLRSELAAIEKVTASRQELERRREHALELIFDQVKYFYPYAHRQTEYHKVQQEVDERVEPVREIWGNEFQPAEGGVPISSRFNHLLGLLRTEQPLLMLGDPDGFREEPEFQPFKVLPSGADRITVRNLALDVEERLQLDRDQRVLAKNAEGPWVALKQEQEQVQITNAYRLMMGRPAVQIHDALVRSARGHCEWMSRTGKFSHFNDEDPELFDPRLRMIAAGYKSGGSGENIARIGGALAAHNAWLHSSGHHRNILFASHREMGTGNMGSLWCQNFAGGQEYEGNLLSEDL